MDASIILANGRARPSLPEISAVQHRRCALEIKLEAQLHLARSDCCVAYGPEGIISDVSVRCAEHRMIKGIFGLDPEFEVHLLTYPELLTNRQIGRERPR